MSNEKNIFLGIVILICLIVCIILFNKKIFNNSADVQDFQIDYGTSSIYTKEDMDEAIQVILNEFKTWDGCKLYRIYYSSDEDCIDEENIKWLNVLEQANDNKEIFEECILFLSDFRSPKNGGGGWNADSEYNQWQWWLARSKDGKWKLMTWGY